MATKEVRFDEYCPLCVHCAKDASEDPCWDCLNQGWNYNSHMPTKFEEDPTKKKEKEKSA